MYGPQHGQPQQHVQSWAPVDPGTGLPMVTGHGPQPEPVGPPRRLSRRARRRVHARERRVRRGRKLVAPIPYFGQ